jgi:glycosyltransferase involved in cell wall biosynthesis
LENIISSFDLNGKVTLVGQVGNVVDWYKKAEIFVLSSRYEGFPNVLLEAMSSGCACIAFNCETGPSDIVQHEHNGILVHNGDIDSLYKAIKMLIIDERKRNILSYNATKIIDFYSEEKIVSEWSNLFNEVILNKNGKTLEKL